MKTFESNGQPFQVGFAEVVKIEYKDNNPNVLQGIYCKGLDPSLGSDDGDASAFFAKPLSPYVRRVPLQGEIVMLIAAPSPAIAAMTPNVNTYYVDIVNVQGLVNHNSVPTAGKVTKGGGSVAATAAGANQGDVPPSPDKNFFEDSNASFIQHYVGDVIFEGRFGQSLRFSSSQKNKNIFSKEPIWEQGSAGDPITILRNSKFEGPANKFYTEDLEKDDSMLILSSTQKLPVKPASNAKKAADAIGIQDKYEKNQILLSSGRIILNAQQEDILAYAKKGVHIAADKVAIDAQSKFTVDSPAIHLGAQAIEPLIFGQKWATWMNNLINALGACFVATGMGPSGPLQANPNWSQVAQLQGQINTLLSQISKTK
jgi:hypothetical protein